MITTIITTFCRPQLLKRAIASVLKQTYPDLQVCVYDNASGDETEEVVQAFMKEDTRVKYHCHSENIGMMANYEYAISRIDTDYFSILSDDDYLLPNCFEIAMKGLENYPDAALSATATKSVDEKGRVVGIPLNEWKTTGYFPARAALVEFIKHPIFPTGIVLNYKLVKTIKADLSKNVLIRWDTNYFLQIISQYPFVTNKRICSVFLNHSDGCTSAFLSRMATNPQLLSHYLTATEIVMNNLMTALKPFPEVKRNTKKAFSYALSREINHHFLSSPFNYKNREFMTAFWMAVSTYRKYHGIDAYMIKLVFRTLLFAFIPWLIPIVRYLLKLPLRIIGRIKRQFLSNPLRS